MTIEKNTGAIKNVQREVDHGLSASALKTIMSKARVLSTSCKLAKDQIEAVNQSEIYSHDYISNKEQEIKSKLADKGREVEPTVVAALDSFLDCETRNESAVSVSDPDLQGALNIISTMGDQISPVEIMSIAQTLAGKRRALEIVRTGIEKAGVICDKNEEQYFYDLGVVYETLRKAAMGVVLDPGNIGGYSTLRDVVSHTAKLLGIELTEEEINPGWTTDQMVEAIFMERASLTTKDIK